MNECIAIAPCRGERSVYIAGRSASQSARNETKTPSAPTAASPARDAVAAAPESADADEPPFDDEPDEPPEEEEAVVPLPISTGT